MSLKKKKSKRYISITENLDRSKTYKVEEAIKLIKEKSKVKFVESFDMCLNLNIDKTKSDQTLRTTVDLPNGNGKNFSIAVICSNEKIDEAKSSGANKVGSDNLIEEISNGKIDFDILVCTPDMMSKVGKLGKILGPKGLMPNPKFGTVSLDIKKSVQDLKKGKVEIRCDKDGNLSLSIGRVNFDDRKIVENFKSVLDVVEKDKPSGSKGNFINSIHVTSTMGPSAKIALTGV
tara:strand:- start:5778 stop:6476 length:699 start_codon:yes stop_codon:yes gene_type:complete